MRPFRGWMRPALAGLACTIAAVAIPADTRAQDLPPEYAELSRSVSDLLSARRYAEAEAPTRRALAIAESTFGPDHFQTITVVVALGHIYRNLGRLAEAEAQYRRALTARTRAVGPDDPGVLIIAANLASTLRGAVRNGEAATLLRDVAARRERLFGPNHPDTLEAVSNLALTEQVLGRYAVALPLYERVLQALTAQLPPTDFRVLTVTHNIGTLYMDSGRDVEAEPYLRRAYTGRTQALGADHPDTLISASMLATLAARLGNFAEAEPLARQAVDGFQRFNNGNDPRTLIALNNLALVYQEQGRMAEAETIYTAQVQASTALLGADHPETLIAAYNLGRLQTSTGQLEESEATQRRVLAARERVLGADNIDTIRTMNGLGLVLIERRQFAEAERLLRRAAGIAERRLGPNDATTLSTINSLAIAVRARGGLDEALALYRRAAQGFTALYGPDHPATIQAQANLALGLLTGRDPGAALEPARAAVIGSRARRSAGGDRFAQAQRVRENDAAGPRFGLLADAAWASVGGTSGRAPNGNAIRAEAFLALQDAMAGGASEAVARQYARRAAERGGPALVALVREREAADAEWQAASTALSDVLGAGSEGTADRNALRGRRDAADARLDAVDARLRSEFPSYYALLQPQALELQQIQALLRPDEAILLVVPTVFSTHAMVITRDGLEWARSGLSETQMRTAVQRLRYDLGARINAPPELVTTMERASPPEGAQPRFDRQLAHQLFQELVAPFASQLDGKLVFVAAGGALSGLPFSVLVAEPPQGADNDPAALRATRWFGDTNALVHVPSLQSLALLRQAPQQGRAPDGFMGFGDPLLQGSATTRSRGAGRAVPQSNAVFASARTRTGGAMAEVDSLRALARLPGTAQELEQVRGVLNAPASSIRLAARATEPAVRTADLSRVRILVFSTHGLTSDEAVGVGEPGLVMTPPAQASETDDGFLAASEVAALRLNADWVILSACNTATGDGAEGQGLSGLARAFFFAGARTLLASHWPVSDDVAPALISRTLALERSGTARPEAFRQAMREIRSNTSHDATGSWAHPFYWAPFIIIGDGR